MSILRFTNLTRYYGDVDIFRGLHAKVPADGAIGIVGPNGIGKTTLLRLLAGVDTPDDGEVVTAKGLRIGYLQQEAIEAFGERENSVFGEMRSVFSSILKMQDQMRELEAALSGAADQTETERLLEQYGILQNRFEDQGGYDFELRIQQTLEGLGFGREEWELPLTHCSGGQKTRALLAKLILEEPDLLIMDEPTNHLDAKAVEWLEGLLLRWDKAFIVVSHDRYFLDTVTKNIWEMNAGGMDLYRGNYSAYLNQREERWRRHEDLFKSTLEFFYKEMDFIHRYIHKRHDQAIGRHKRLVRHVKAVEVAGPEALEMKWSAFCQNYGISSTKWSIRDTDAHIRQLKCRTPRQKKMKMRIMEPDHISTINIQSSQIEVGYPEKSLFTSEPLELLKGERAALIGPNGTGKSTFINTLKGDIPLVSGTISIGDSLKVGYFAQDHAIVDPENRVVDEIMINSGKMLESEARTYLGSYLFSGEDAYKKVGHLSGGERGRLILAILALKEVNFLILDEPTNHLDIHSREILEEALIHFKGTVLLVTHDRYLIDRVANQIWSLEEGKLNVYEGNYTDWQKTKAQELELNRANREESSRRNTWRQSGDNGKKVIDPVAQMAETEAEIHRLEAEITDLGQKLEGAVQNGEEHKIGEWQDRYLEANTKLGELMTLWENLAAKAV